MVLVVRVDVLQTEPVLTSQRGLVAPGLDPGRRWAEVQILPTERRGYSNTLARGSSAVFSGGVQDVVLSRGGKGLVLPAAGDLSRIPLTFDLGINDSNKSPGIDGDVQNEEPQPPSVKPT
ncbi:unnamed protein product [Pleuronectes platessa]|uniref:Uncharacterized protein n=1 Tax=Pleuronectes platessa TaxID=8262 RepID=A0A9N7UJP2_PLEPL|nr:unnamed protein product [Pleuronectes platessa]